MQIILIFFAIKYCGNWDAIYKALEAKERVTLSQITQTEALVKASAWSIVTILDLAYPNGLKTAYKPPFVIWMSGNKNALNKPLICLTGNDSSTQVKSWIDLALNVIKPAANVLVRDFSAVDLQIARQLNGERIFVLPSGFNAQSFSFETNAQDLLISEYPPDVAASKETFRDRNRLLAALATSLVLFSSRKDNGINNLVNNFLNLGKEIYCYPGNDNVNDGNNELIKQGATLITTLRDIPQLEMTATN